MIDFHIHTTATPHHSSWAPEQLAGAAASAGLHAIAAVDHNTTIGVRALQAAGVRHGVRVIAGVEIDSGFAGKLWHTLVYGVDPEEPALLALCAAVFERNMADAAALRVELARRGFTLDGLDARTRHFRSARPRAELPVDAKQNRQQRRPGGATAGSSHRETAVRNR